MDKEGRILVLQTEMIDIKVNTFLTVCKTMNYTKAAEELGFTQPSVSMHIRALEEFYSVKLFLYQNKKLELTKQGEYLKKHLETLSHDLNYMKDSLQSMEGKKKIRIGATLSIGEFYIPKQLSLYLKEHTDVELAFIVADTKELLKRLDLGELDFLLCEGYFDKNQYEYELIKKEEMCIVCARDYYFIQMQKLDDLFSHHILLRENGSGTRDIFENYLKEHNYSIQSFARYSEFSSPHMIKRLLLDGVGISVLYRTVVENELRKKQLVEIKIPKFYIQHEFNAVWKKNSIFGEEYRDIIKSLLTKK